MPQKFTDAPITPDEAKTLGLHDTALEKEPDTYWAGFRKGLSEGASGGWTGFVKGLKESPASLVSGTKALLTTNPITTIEQTAAGIGRIPAAVERAGTDPEEWGQSVGNLTGQTMLTAALPAATEAAIVARAPIGRGVTAVGRGVEAIGKSKPATYGATAGAYHGLMRGSVPEAALAVSAPYAMTKAGQGLQVVGKAISGESATAARSALQQAIDQAVENGTLRRDPRWTPESGSVTQRGPGGRPVTPTAAQQITEAVGPVNEAAAVTPPPAPPSAPPFAGPAAPSAASETPPTAPPSAPATPIPQGVAMKQGIDAFKAAGKMPQPGEVSWVTHWIQQGMAPAEAVAKSLAMRPAPVDPAAALAAKLGTPSDTEVQGAVTAKNQRTTRAKGGTKPE